MNMPRNHSLAEFKMNVPWLRHLPCRLALVAKVTNAAVLKVGRYGIPARPSPYGKHTTTSFTRYINAKSFPSHKAHRVALISISLALSQTPVYNARYWYSFGLPRRDGQAEFTCRTGYIPRWFTRLQTVTHPSTNRARLKALLTQDSRRDSCLICSILVTPMANKYHQKEQMT